MTVCKKFFVFMKIRLSVCIIIPVGLTVAINKKFALLKFFIIANSINQCVVTIVNHIDECMVTIRGRLLFEGWLRFEENKVYA